jgi:hypothetical protein
MGLHIFGVAERCTEGYDEYVRMHYLGYASQPEPT